ncbi:MAG: hypothetical protein HYT87_02210 [Nitrospirae bacterium]|nr:hypothetical protein [Nitrospirota bacterium]
MVWIFLAEALVFAALIPLIIRSRKKTAKEGDLELERESLEEGLNGEEVRNLLGRLSNFILNWDGELERMDKRAAAVLIEQKARVKEGHDLEVRMEAELHQIKGEQRQREEHSQKEVAKSILGMVVREKSPTELLDWAHPTSEAYSRATQPSNPAQGTGKPAELGTASKPTVASASRPASGPPGKTAPTSPPKSAAPVRSWKPEKVFAS